METIQERALRLKDAGMGSLEDGRLSDQSLVRLGHECVLDALSVVYDECSNSTTLSKDKYISKFLKKCTLRVSYFYLYCVIDKPAIEEFEKLRLKETDFITKGIIGQGHFGEVSVDCYYR